MGRRNHVLGGGPDPLRGRVNFWGLSGPFKSMGNQYSVVSGSNKINNCDSGTGQGSRLAGVTLSISLAVRPSIKIL